MSDAEINEIKLTGRSFLRHSYQQLSGEDILESYSVEEKAIQLASMGKTQEVCSIMVDWECVVAGPVQ